jgi:hypothetical protein
MELITGGRVGLYVSPFLQHFATVSLQGKLRLSEREEGIVTTLATDWWLTAAGNLWFASRNNFRNIKFIFAEKNQTARAAAGWTKGTQLPAEALSRPAVGHTRPSVQGLVS